MDSGVCTVFAGVCELYIQSVEFNHPLELDLEDALVLRLQDAEGQIRVIPEDLAQERVKLFAVAEALIVAGL